MRSNRMKEVDPVLSISITKTETLRRPSFCQLWISSYTAKKNILIMYKDLKQYMKTENIREDKNKPLLAMVSYPILF